MRKTNPIDIKSEELNKKRLERIQDASSVYITGNCDDDDDISKLADWMASQTDRDRLIIQRYPRELLLSDEAYARISERRIESTDMVYVCNSSGRLNWRINREIASAIIHEHRVCFENDTPQELYELESSNIELKRPPIIVISPAPSVMHGHGIEFDEIMKMRQFDNDARAVVFSPGSTRGQPYCLKHADAIVYVVANDTELYDRRTWARDTMHISVPIIGIPWDKFSCLEYSINISKLFTKEDIRPVTNDLIVCRPKEDSDTPTVLDIGRVTSYVESPESPGIDLLTYESVRARSDLLSIVYPVVNAARVEVVHKESKGDHTPLRINIIGSMHRNRDTINNLSIKLKCLGYHVTSPENFRFFSDGLPITPENIDNQVIQRMHYLEDCYIDNADVVICVSGPDNYIGNDTRREIDYAIANCKEVYTLAGDIKITTIEPSASDHENKTDINDMIVEEDARMVIETHIKHRDQSES